MNNLSNLSNRSGVEQAEVAGKSTVSEATIKAAIRVVETSNDYLRIAEKSAAAGRPVSRADYDRAKAQHDDAMKTIARGLAESGDTVGATQVLRMRGRRAMPGN
jgi:hypothetical protein